MATTKRDYYEVLGVKREATIEEVKVAYRQMAKKFHPDKNPGDADSERKFREAAEAFEVLGDDEKRRRYDRYGHAGVEGAGGVHDFRTPEDIFAHFSDIFGNGGLFGDAFGGGRRRGPRPGQDLMVRLDITMEEAARGATRPIELDRHDSCETCKGSGAKPGTIASSCDYCGGRGQVVQARGFFQMAATCPACGGAGSRITDPCVTCRGSGRERKRVTIPVAVPPGVDTGMILQVRGQGEAGDPGAPRGNLRVQIRVKPHSLFERDGPNLLCQVPISFPQAALGAEIEVPTLDGPTTVTIERGTQTGEVFKLRGRGLPEINGRGRGDQLVEVVIETPKRLSPREEELLRELADLEHHDVSPRRKSFFDKIRDYFTEETDEPESA